MVEAVWRRPRGSLRRDDCLERGDHLAGIGGLPDVAAAVMPWRRLPPPKRPAQDVQRAVGGGAAGATTMAGVPSTTLANSAVDPVYQVLTMSGAVSRRRARRTARSGGTLLVAHISPEG